MPERYRRYEKEPWRSGGRQRALPIDKYVIFYISDKENKIVTIIRVMYNGCNIEEQLNVHTKFK